MNKLSQERSHLLYFRDICSKKMQPESIGGLSFWPMFFAWGKNLAKDWICNAEV